MKSLFWPGFLAASAALLGFAWFRNNAASSSVAGFGLGPSPNPGYVSGSGSGWWSGVKGVFGIAGHNANHPFLHGQTGQGQVPNYHPQGYGGYSSIYPGAYPGAYAGGGAAGAYAGNMQRPPQFQGTGSNLPNINNNNNFASSLGQNLANQAQGTVSQLSSQGQQYVSGAIAGALGNKAYNYGAYGNGNGNGNFGNFDLNQWAIGLPYYLIGYTIPQGSANTGIPGVCPSGSPQCQTLALVPNQGQSSGTNPPFAVPGSFYFVANNTDTNAQTTCWQAGYGQPISQNANYPGLAQFNLITASVNVPIQIPSTFGGFTGANIGNLNFGQGQNLPPPITMTVLGTGPVSSNAGYAWVLVGTAPQGQTQPTQFYVYSRNPANANNNNNNNMWQQVNQIISSLPRVPPQTLVPVNSMCLSQYATVFASSLVNNGGIMQQRPVAAAPGITSGAYWSSLGQNVANNAAQQASQQVNQQLQGYLHPGQGGAMSPVQQQQLPSPMNNGVFPTTANGVPIAPPSTVMQGGGSCANGNCGAPFYGSP